uniref:TECR-like N-terminal domain-containing protein n=1 Tax=Aotus nancymaae TaxID=37293 RepID=A0A2K5EEA1_AOTNA
MKHYEVEILDEKLCFLDKVEPHATIVEIKNLFTKTHTVPLPGPQGHHGHTLLSGCGEADLLGDGLPNRVRGAPFHLSARLLPSDLHLWPQI